MTTQDVIKLLPFEEQTKMQLLNMFEFMSPSQKLRVERIAWNTYYMLFRDRLNENLAAQFERVQNGEEQIGNNFQERAVQNTRQQITEQFHATSANIDLTAARKAMEQIVNEIEATKKN